MDRTYEFTNKMMILYFMHLFMLRQMFALTKFYAIAYNVTCLMCYISTYTSTQKHLPVPSLRLDSLS